VRPHPHIGLATVTYLFEGGQVHRDSLGNVQAIVPGDVNWMTAGRGIVHSERTGPKDRAAGHLLHGLQTWVALPKSHEQVEPSFSHHPKASLPEIDEPGVTMRLLAGTAFGRRAPTPTFSPMIYLAIDLAAGAAVDLPPEHEERGVYVIDGDVQVGGVQAPVGHLAVLTPELTARIEAKSASRLVVLGGAKMDGTRLIWWNFVASSKDLIDSASARWSERGYPPVPGETEFIPLP
jgi:redox-sensitive bicupin YhaK (pirin superfamily)